MWRKQIAALGLVLIAVILVKVGEEAYRWFAFPEQREQLREVDTRLEEAGYQLVRSQIRVDSLRTLVGQADENLMEGRSRLDSLEQYADRGTLPPGIYDRYRAELTRFNLSVAQRNAILNDLESAVRRNHAAVDRYNVLADSLRGIAASLGEPYYDVPSPVEMAARRDLVHPR
ncbi:hypothetical protein BH23GEM6_BH23GEM6_16550 [soil metagenome]